MKLTKKIIVAAMAIVGLSFTACMKDITGNNIIKTGSNGTDAYVEYTNEAAEDSDEAVSSVRSLRSARLQRSGGVFTITQQVNGDKDGMLGAVFNLHKNSKGLYDFFVVGTSIQKKNVNSSYEERGYISYFVNVSTENFQEYNFGAYVGDPKDKNDRTCSLTLAKQYSDDSNNTTPYEVVIQQIAYSTLVPSLSSDIFSNNKYVIDIAIYPKYDLNQHKFDGGFVVKVGKGLGLDEATDGDNEYRICNGTVLYTKDISSVFTMPSGEEGNLDKVPENELGYYCNIYPGQQLEAEWELYDTINMVVEE